MILFGFWRSVSHLLYLICGCMTYPFVTFIYPGLFQYRHYLSELENELKLNPSLFVTENVGRKSMGQNVEDAMSSPTTQKTVVTLNDSDSGINEFPKVNSS